MFEEITVGMDAKKWEGHPRLKTAGKKLPEAAEVTPEAIERRNARSNKPYMPRHYYFNSQASKDGIRHFVDGLGDVNPCFRDEEYAKTTKYGRIIAPGSYLYTVLWAPPGSGMPGVHSWYSGGDWEWYRPIFAGDEFRTVCILRPLVIKQGKMTGGGNIYIEYVDVVFINQREEIVGKELQHIVWAGRAASGGAGKYRDIEKPVYSREDWTRILEVYDREEIRGSKPRYWEDVKVGDKLGPFIKGPLTVRDIVVWLMGAGSPFFKADRLEFDYERRHPMVLEYVKETGEADVPELVHILDAFARTVGVSRAYDYGNQRMSWLCKLFTNWMGDDGFLWRMSGDERLFNMVGDITIFEGTVIKKYVEEGRCCVEIEAGAKQQDGKISMPPRNSTVILPSRQYGAIQYPDPPKQIVEEVKRARPLNEMIKEGLI